MWLVVLSSLVSLFTLAVLFFRPRQVEKKWIPSWFLGNARKQIFHIKIIFTLPPFIPFILILLATLCFAAVYYPRKIEKGIVPSNTFLLVWVDSSFSAQMSRAAQGFTAESAADLTFERHEHTYGLETEFVLQEGQPKVETRLRRLENREQMVTFFKAQETRPFSPFLQSLDLKRVEEVLSGESELVGKRGHLIAFSDGRQESMAGLYTLKKHFQSAQLVRSIPYHQSALNSFEVVPRALTDIWKSQPEEGKTSQLTAESAQSDFLNYEKHNLSIPQEARPRLFVKTYGAKGKSFAVLDQEAEQQILPLIVACTQSNPGHVDFDSFSTLRQLSRFFQTKLIETPCEEIGTVANETQNPWRYRAHAIWVVPLSEDIFADFREQGRFWLPRGFNHQFDSLVYVAPPSLPGDALEMVPLQLDADVLPVPLHLAPLPPRGDLTFKIPGERSGYRGAFTEFYRVNERFPIAWKAGTLPIFYLRTPVATPNSELGRSHNWLQFWLQVAGQIPSAKSSLKRIELRDASKLSEEWESVRRNADVHLTSKLNLGTLAFEPTSQFQLGLYKSAQDSSDMFLFTTQFHNSSKNFVSEEGFAKNFISLTEKNSDVAKESSEQPYSLFSILVALGGAFALLWLWQKEKKATAALMCFFCLWLNPTRPAAAQELVSSVYRIAWCGETVSPALQQRYTALRNVLMARGTIQLPPELLPHACKPSAAEIWWTNDFKTLALNDLKDHMASGGVFILEGTSRFPEELLQLNDSTIGRMWESPAKRGMFYRSFYLLSAFDGCASETTQVLMLRKKANAQSPFGVVTSASFLGQKPDCFSENMDYRVRSFVNLVYALFTTDYKEDQMQLPEILNRVRSLGLEP